MNIYQQIINNKLKTITPEELMSYGKQYDIIVTREQALKVISLVKSMKKIDIFDTGERKKLLKEIARVTNQEVAIKLNQLFLKFVK